MEPHHQMQCIVIPRTLLFYRGGVLPRSRGYYCYIIAKGFFLYYHFFVGYILSFGLVRLTTVQLSARLGSYIERRCSRSREKDVTFTDVITKIPDRMGLGM